MSAPRAHQTSPAPPWAGAAQPRYNTNDFDINDQYGQNISNVGGNQYNAYVTQRQSFLRDVASTKTKARFLAWFGFLLFVAGGGLYAAVILRFIEGVGDAGPDTDPTSFELLGPKILGVPAGVIGFAAAGIGSIMLIVGIVLHIVASSRRRQVERTMPLYPPPRGY